MFKTVLGAITSDMALDIGTANTRVFVPDRGVVISEATALASMVNGRGQSEVLAIGDEAWSMEGRCPRDIEVFRPVQDGQVTDFDSLDILLRHWVLQVQGRRLWVGPRMAIVIPFGTTDVEQRALRESAEAAGAREVILIEHPIAASVGCDLPVHAARGQMLVDMGAATTSISVVSLGGIVHSCTMPLGGYSMDRDIVLHLRDHRGLHISRAAAEIARVHCVSFGRGSQNREVTVRGRDIKTGFPRSIKVSKDELTQAVDATMKRTSDTILRTLERIPGELASDIAELGILLAGGCARIDGIDQAIGMATGLPLITAETPERAAVQGACRMLNEPALGELVAG